MIDATEQVRASTLATGDLVQRPGGTFTLVSDVDDCEEFGAQIVRSVTFEDGSKMVLDPQAVVEVAA